MLTTITAAAMCGCTSTQYVPVERTVIRTDTVSSIKFRIDSVIYRDSVAVFYKGDTVTITRWRDRYRVKMQTDTLYQSLTDSVRVPEPYSVERKLTRWEQTKMDFGGFALGGVAVALCIAVVWLIRKFRK